MIEGQKILITGSSGFLGNHIAEKLEKNNELFVLGRKKPVGLECHFIETDLRNSLDIAKLPASMDMILHLSAVVGATGENSLAVFQVNTSSTLSLLEYAKTVGVKKFVFMSTGNTCGYHENTIQEDYNVNLAELDFYSFSKAVSEFLVQRYSPFFVTLIIRPFYPYGPGQRIEQLIPRLIGRIKHNKPILIYNQGRYPRLSLIHIQDFVEAFLRVLELKEPTILNVASHEHLSIKEIAEIIATRLDKKVNFKEKEDTTVKNRIGSTEKMVRLLGFEPKIPFQQAIREMI